MNEKNVINRTLPPISTFEPFKQEEIGIISLPLLSKDEKNQNKGKIKKSATKRPIIKYKFTPEEDNKLFNIVINRKDVNWNKVAAIMKTRNARQCRERWNNYLDPKLRNEPWTWDEDRILLEKHQIYGTKYGKIAQYFFNRSDNSIRNRIQQLTRKMEKNYNSLNYRHSVDDSKIIYNEIDRI